MCMNTDIHVLAPPGHPLSANLALCLTSTEPCPALTVGIVSILLQDDSGTDKQETGG